MLNIFRNRFLDKHDCTKLENNVNFCTASWQRLDAQEGWEDLLELAGICFS